MTRGVDVSFPLAAKKFVILRSKNDVFFMIKAFAAGVILATLFVHILPDANVALPQQGDNDIA
ncbi:hypothetical protein ACS0TY_000406 [Phlomoides rotata]